MAGLAEAHAARRRQEDLERDLDRALWKAQAARVARVEDRSRPLEEDDHNAVKIYCGARTTEQAWVFDLIEAELARRAPDLWSVKPPSGKKALKERKR